VDVTFRPVDLAEVPEFSRVASIGFAEPPSRLHERRAWADLDIDRTLAGFEGDELVSTSRNYSLELTVPGGTSLPAAGVSAVTVLPTHRRRGVLREMMRGLLDEAVGRGEPVAMLTASEPTIYERFGFGITTRTVAIELDRREIEFAQPRPAGRLRILEPDAASKLEPEVFARVQAEYPGAISRPDAWWGAEQWERRFGLRYDVSYESVDGRVDGYACYGVRERFDTGSANVLTVRDLVAATPTAEAALWRFVCEVDLVRTVGTHRAPLDLALPWMLTSNRAVRVGGVADEVWTRLLDVPAALAARAYAVDGHLGLAVHDEFRPHQAADGTVTLDGGPDGATAQPGGDADLACSVSALSAAWLGGVRWSTLARAGLVEERRAGALATADAMFASDPLPYPFTWF
jgi:predicted acetyltransferase